MRRHPDVPARWKVKHLEGLNSTSGDSDDGVRYVPCVKKGELAGLDAVHITIDPGKSLPMHVHRRSTCVVFVVEGHAVARIGRRTARVKMNDFVLVPPGIRHSFAARDLPVVLFTIHTPPLYGRGDDPDIVYTNGRFQRQSSHRARRMKRRKN